MKRTQRKDAFSNIRRQFISFLSILIVIALGVGIYLACRNGALAMRGKGNLFYEETNYHDLEVRSTHGITAEDLDAVLAMDGVTDAESVFTQDLAAEGTDGRAVVHVISGTERLDQPFVIEGEFPQSAKECAAEPELLELLGLKVGDTMKLETEAGEISEFLSGKEFRITGAIRHPDNYHFGDVTTYDVLLAPSAFHSDREEVTGTGLLIRTDASEMETFSPEYEQRIHTLLQELEALGKERAAMRDASLRAEAQQEIDDAREKLDNSRQELEDGQAEYESNRQELEDAREELNASAEDLNDARRELIDSEKELGDSKEELDSGYTELEDAAEALRQAEAELNTSAGSLNEAAQELNAQKEQLDKSAADLETMRQALIQSQGTAKAAQMQAAYEQNAAAYQQGLAAYNAKAAEYEASKGQYDAKLNEYNENSSLYNQNLESYNASFAEYGEGLDSYDEGRQSLEDGEKEYEEKKQDYLDAEAELAEGAQTLKEKEEELLSAEQDLTDAEERLAELEDGRWIIPDRTLNQAWHELKETVRAFESIGRSFALLFVLLGVLVCYATIGKIIDEQRILVGTTKALGFHKDEIFGKYLMFGAGSALLGCLAGLMLAYFVLEKLILDSVEEAYLIGSFPKVFEPVPAVLAVIIGIAVAGIATWVACRKLLALPAVTLLGGAVPESFLRKEEKHNSGKSLYSRLIWRNILTDWKRVLVTVISIAGCCMLLIIGFSLRFSFDEVISRQYEQIVHYDAIVRYLDGRSETTAEKLQEILDENGIDSMPMYELDTFAYIGDERETLQIRGIDPGKAADFYLLHDVGGKQDAEVPAEGMLIYKRLAEVYDLHTGDTISVVDKKGVSHEVPVAGVYNNYAGKAVFLSRAYAAGVFGEDYAENAFAVKLNGADAEALREDLNKADGFLSIAGSDEEREKYQLVADSLNTVILVMIVMAGIMAAVVLLNLVRIQINQKKRELTIMRINGFTTGETVGYILRENVITTLLGIGLGLVIGNLAARFNLHSIERIELQMIREISIKACVYSVLITIIFAVIINFLALRKIRGLNLGDVN